MRSILAQPDAKEVWAQRSGRVVEQLEKRFKEAAEILAERAEDILAFTHLRGGHLRPTAPPSSGWWRYASRAERREGL